MDLDESSVGQPRECGACGERREEGIERADTDEVNVHVYSPEPALHGRHNKLRWTSDDLGGRFIIDLDGRVLIKTRKNASTRDAIYLGGRERRGSSARIATKSTSTYTPSNLHYMNVIQSIQMDVKKNETS